MGVIQGQHEKTNYRKMVQVVTAQTITRRWKIIDKMREYHPGLILIDEAHCQHKAHREMQGMWRDNVIIGLSATPWAKGMRKMYSSLVVGATTKQLIEEGYLCNYTAFAPYTPDLKKVKTLEGDYQVDSLEKEYNNKSITGGIVDTWLDKGENRQTICFAVNIAHSKAIVDEFCSRGVVAYHIDAYTDKEERKEIIDNFKKGKINLLSSMGVLTKGFDCPSATCLIIARPTKSLMLHIQILGRVLRVSPCGKDALILDHAGNIGRLGFPDDDMPDTLNDDKKKDAITKKRDELEKMEKAPKPCVVCHFLHHEFKCPACGHVPVIKHGVNHVKGELVKIKQSAMAKRNQTTSKADKQSFYSAALGYAKVKGYKEGWAANAYRDRFSVWPNAVDKIVGQSTQVFENFLRAKNIRYAKSRK